MSKDGVYFLCFEGPNTLKACSLKGKLNHFPGVCVIPIPSLQAGQSTRPWPRCPKVRLQFPELWGLPSCSSFFSEILKCFAKKFCSFLGVLILFITDFHLLRKNKILLGAKLWQNNFNFYRVLSLLHCLLNLNLKKKCFSVASVLGSFGA